MSPITSMSKIRQAAEFIFERKKEKPAASITALIDEAGMRFNLTPLDTEALMHILSENDKNK